MGFVLKNSKTDKSLIVFSKRYKGVQLKYSAGYSIKVKQWDVRNQRCKTRGVDEPSRIRNLSINSRLSDLESEYETLLARAMAFGNPVTKAYLKTGLDEAMKDGSSGSHSKHGDLKLLDLLDRFIEDSESGARTSKDGNRIKPSRIQTYRIVRDKIEQKFPLVMAADLDYSFQQRLIELLNAQDYARNTVGKYNSIFRAALRYCKYLGLVDAKLLDHPNRFKLHEQSENVYLNVDEINQLINLELKDTYARVRDVFVAMCYLGVRISDYKQLDESKFVEEDMLRIITVKTNEVVYIPVHHIVREIFEKYDGFPPTISEQKMNKYIKKICLIAEFDEPFQFTRTIGGRPKIFTKKKYELISLHTARRSFATNAYLAGMDTMLIMSITGHKKEKTLIGYICVTKEQQASRMREHAFFNK